jgi:hypothetical protein
MHTSCSCLSLLFWKADACLLCLTLNRCSTSDHFFLAPKLGSRQMKSFSLMFEIQQIFSGDKHKGKQFFLLLLFFLFSRSLEMILCVNPRTRLCLDLCPSAWNTLLSCTWWSPLHPLIITQTCHSSSVPCLHRTPLLPPSIPVLPLTNGPLTRCVFFYLSFLITCNILTWKTKAKYHPRPSTALRTESAHRRMEQSGTWGCSRAF